MVLVFMGNRVKKLNSKCSLQLITDDFQQLLSSEAVVRSRGGQLAQPCLRVMSWGVSPAAVQCEPRVGWAGPEQRPEPDTETQPAVTHRLAACPPPLSPFATCGQRG